MCDRQVWILLKSVTYSLNEGVVVFVVAVVTRSHTRSHILYNIYSRSRSRSHIRCKIHVICQHLLLTPQTSNYYQCIRATFVLLWCRFLIFFGMQYRWKILLDGNWFGQNIYFVTFEIYWKCTKMNCYMWVNNDNSKDMKS